MMEVGKAKYGSGKKFHKLMEGNNVFRILPPLGALAQKGIWSRYYRVEWGYKDTNNKIRTFLDCRVVNRQTNMVEVESAAHLRREQLKAAQLKFKEAGDEANVKATSDLLKQFNLEAKHHMNAVNLQGEIGLLKIGHNAKKLLDEQIKNIVESEGIDPLGVDTGIYFNIQKIGKGRDTTYQVSVFTQNVEAEIGGQKTIVQQKVMHKMDQAFINRLENEAFNLEGMYPAPTALEIQEMVTVGPEAVQRIMDTYKPVQNTRANTEDVLAKAEELSQATVETVAVAAVENQGLPENPTALDLINQSTPAELQQSLAPQQAAPETPAPAPQAEVPATPTTPAASTSELSDADFVAQLKAGN